MSIREQTSAGSPRPDRTHRMVRVYITDDMDVFAEWIIELPTGKRATRSVQVTSALRDLIRGRATFQTLMDQVAADTSPRLGV